MPILLHEYERQSSVGLLQVIKVTFMKFQEGQWHAQMTAFQNMPSLPLYPLFQNVPSLEKGDKFHQ